MDKTDIKSLTADEIAEELSALGEKTFRAVQIFEWLHAKQVSSFDEMTNISKALREKLDNKFYISSPYILQKLSSHKDGTVKYLFDIGGNTIIESVFMPYNYGNSVCVSSQAGCRMGCSFCASTVDGLERDLLAGEIAGQVYQIQSDTGKRISNVVIMGSGEPLDNYDNILNFIKIINSDKGMGIGMRHITLSTCGIVDKIYRLMELRLQITLAISLHAPNDDIRRSIMPVANRYPIDELICAAKKYADVTKRRVTYEYALIRGVNDSRENAVELAGRLHGSMCHVNLIPVNDVKENNYIRSSEENIKAFASVLDDNGIEVTVRRRLGSDINAACGQLRKRYKDNRGV